MKFKLPRQLYLDSFSSLVAREIKKQKIVVSRATKKNLQGIAQVCRLIQEKGIPEYLVLKKLRKSLGYGIFLHPKAPPIRKGDIIAPYAGELRLMPQNEAYDSDYTFAPITEIRLTKAEQKKFDPKRKFHPRRLYSLDLDASSQGNFTRFINHSETPNIEAHLLKIPRNELGLEPSSIEIVYVAKKTIRPGEQLLVCYEDEEKSYWGCLNIKPLPMDARTFIIDSSFNILSQ